MSGLVIAGNTSGSVTLDAPAIAGSTVITLPDTSGTMLTTTSAATGTGDLVKATAPTLSSPVLVTPNLGTPSAVVLTNATGTANSLNAGIGVNQTWIDVTGSRALGGAGYTNTTGKPIMVSVFIKSNTSAVQGITSTFSINGSVVDTSAVYSASVVYGTKHTVIIPAGATYVCSLTGGSAVLNLWTELR